MQAHTGPLTHPLPWAQKPPQASYRAQSTAFHLTLEIASNLSRETFPLGKLLIRLFIATPHSQRLSTGSSKESSEQDLAHLSLVQNIHQQILNFTPNITTQGCIHKTGT